MSISRSPVALVLFLGPLYHVFHLTPFQRLLLHFADVPESVARFACVLLSDSFSSAKCSLAEFGVVTEKRAARQQVA